MISASDFYNWKLDPVTQAFFSACQKRIMDAREILGNSAGIDSNDDNFNRGMIRAYTEIIQVQFEDEKGELEV